jgi:acetoin utilization deacetylase AcuC-like enzyme
MKVFYNEKQSTDKNPSDSPSSGKPALLVKYWQEQGFPIEVVSDFEPATREQLYRCHAKDYVDAVLECRANNGFSNKVPEVAATLPWTTGSFVAAAVHAFESGDVTMSPTSGFHHASQATPLGFCTFNGLMVAALELLNQGAKRIGILDLDHHYGNGTDEIIKWLGSDPAISARLGWDVGPEKFHHYTFGADFSNYHWKGGDQAEAWLNNLLPWVLDSYAIAGCDIVLYQAGADPHVDDPHGGSLTSEQMARRDMIVFTELKKLEIPVAWNLAGGYQIPIQKVLDIHTETLKAHLAVEAEVVES